MGHGQGQNQNTQGNVPVVPEVNPVWVLSPIFGAVLLLSSWHCVRGAQAPAGNLLSSGRLSALGDDGIMTVEAKGSQNPTHGKELRRQKRLSVVKSSN